MEPEHEHEQNEALDRAWVMLEEGDIIGARAIGETLANAAEDSADAHLLLAGCARAEGDNDGALAHLTRAGQADPDWATPEVWRADILRTLPDPAQVKEALACVTAALDKAEEQPEYLEALLLKAEIEIELEKLSAARKTLGELPDPRAVELDPLVLAEVGYLWLDVGDAKEATSFFQTLVERQPLDADAWHGLGMAAELAGDQKAKATAWVKTLELDSQARAVTDEGDELTEAVVTEVAERALAELPARARQLLANIPILVVDLPSAEDVATGLDPRLLGLFQGTPLPEVSTLGAAPGLTQILLFRKNLARVASDAADLESEIEITLLHETGHFFGMTEDDLFKVGLD